MTLSVNKNTVFSALLILVVALIIIRIIPVSVDPIIKVVISKNSTSITSIYQQRDIVFTREVMIDRVNLLHKSRFSHPELGNIANYSDDFFVDISRNFRVTKAGNVNFLVGSDDGFSLTVNNKLICEHLNDRPYSIQTCMIFLPEGEHQLHLSYFQGFGNSGLTLEYAQNDGKQYWFGDESDGIKFD